MMQAGQQHVAAVVDEAGAVVVAGRIHGQQAGAGQQEHRKGERAVEALEHGQQAPRERRLVEDGRHGDGIIAARSPPDGPQGQFRARFLIIAACRPPPTCSTSTASAPRPGRPRRSQMAQRVAQRHPQVHWWCPQLPPSPREAMDAGDAGIAGWPRSDGGDGLVPGRLLRHLCGRADRIAGRCCSIRRSTRRATWCVTSATRPPGTTRPSISFSGREYIDELRALEAGAARRGRNNYFAVIAKGDEVLDWREMTARYPGAGSSCSKAATMRCRISRPGTWTKCWLPRPRLSSLAAAHGTIRAMYALFEEAGKFLAGRVMSEAEASAQVELDTRQAGQGQGRQRRCCVREAGAGRADRRGAARWPPTIDLDLAWEFAPEGEFGFAELARDYFERQRRRRRSRRRRCSRLFEAPHYFRRAGKGRFKKAPEPRSSRRRWPRIEKKKQVAGADRRLGRASWPPATARRRSASSCTRSCSSRTRTRPNTRRWSRRRARTQHRAARAAASGRRDRLALPVPLAPLPVRELPQGHRLPAAAGAGDQGRTAAGAGAGLLDRRFAAPPRSTTRCRCRAWAAGTVTVGIHIAAPGLALAAGSAIDQVARDAAVHGLHAGLQDHDAARRRGAGLHAAGRAATARPSRCTSTFDEADAGAARPRETRLERVPIAANLRHDQLERVDHRGDGCRPGRSRGRAERGAAARAAVVPVPAGQAAEGAARGGARQARELQPARLQLPPRSATTAPSRAGDEQVQIAPRQRGAPLDLIVAEAMILANSTWGGWLAELRRARHLPQPGQPGARRQGAHGHQGRCRTPASASRSYAWAPRRCAATSTS